MSYGVIYKITNLITKMLYIGQTTKSMESRFKNHCSRKEKLNYLQNSIKAHGKENFIVEQIGEAENADDLNNLEIHFIKELNTLWPNGYNLTEGGRSGKRSEESKKTASRVRLGKSTKKKGRKYGPQPNISLAQKGKKRGPMKVKRGVYGMMGKNHSQETKDKISKNLTGRPAIHSHVAVNSYNPETNQVTYYPSVSVAADFLKIGRTSITNNLTGLSKSCAGLKFSYTVKE